MKVVTFGELMVRLQPFNYERFVQANSLEFTFGGGEANVAVSLANYGLDAAFVTKLPAHAIGQAAVNSLRRYGVDTSMITRGGDRVGIYYNEKGASQRGSVCIYDRANSAIQLAQPSDFDWDKIFEGLSQLDGAVGAVVDADGTTLRSTLLIVVDANAIAAAGDHAGVNAIAAQAVDSGLTDCVCGELGDEGCVQTVVGQRNSNICLAAAEGELQAVSLNETLVVERLQTDHQFAKSNNFHWLFSFYLQVFMTFCCGASPAQQGFHG